MSKLISLAWLRLERIPDAVVDFTPGFLLLFGGLLVLGLATAQ